jgi:hypothetical protein
LTLRSDHASFERSSGGRFVSTIRAFLLSLLVRQFLVLREGFAQKYPFSWLVWEPGNWSAPRTRDPDTADTQMPTGKAPTQAQNGDSLCFELVQGPVPRKQTLNVGRGSENDIVINDATVSREHVVLSLGDDGQWAARAAQATSTLLCGVALSASAPRPLHSGDTLQMGDVLLTFYERTGFTSRLERESKR